VLLDSSNTRCDQITFALIRVGNRRDCTYIMMFGHIVSSPLSLQMSQETSVQAVLQALQVFSGQPDKPSIDAANRWLQDFQHTVSIADNVDDSRKPDIAMTSLKPGGRVITFSCPQNLPLPPRRSQLRRYVLK